MFVFRYIHEVKIKPHPGFATKAIHIGSEPDPIHGMVVPTIGLSTTYAQRSPGVPYSKFDYSRVGNPTREAFERCLASLEYANYCIASSSGCASMTTILLLLSSGDHVRETTIGLGSITNFIGYFLVMMFTVELRDTSEKLPRINTKLTLILLTSLILTLLRRLSERILR